MAAAPIVVESRDEKIRDINARKGATRIEQRDTNMNGTWERPSPMSSSQPTNIRTEIEETLLSRSEQSSSPAIPTPANAEEEATFQAQSALSLSTDTGSAVVLGLVESTVRPTSTAQVDMSTNATSSIRAASTIAPAFLVDSGAKINEEALPDMNQQDPSLVTVPGINQQDPVLVTAPTITPLAASESSLAISSISTMTADKPMPGKNQPKPTAAVATTPSTTLSGFTSTIVPALSISSLTTSTAISNVADVSTISFALPPTLAIYTSSPTEPSTTTSSSVLSPVLTFVTITRTAKGKEDARSSIQSVAAPLAVTAPQSLSSSFLTSSLVVGSAVPSSLATAVNVEPQSGLTPLARSLFILFGVLGFVTILIALGIFWVMRSNKRRTQAARQQAALNPVEETGEDDGYGNTIRISSNNSIKTFLTESEKAIVNRAATPDGDTDASAKPSNALTDAINSFIIKSRRLTYKISP
ncbi:hypothetical protein G6011_01621 [Alternaria panax]|uniref:Uncharacterized protein n=1 Tax=Alternaria panax TaxID=48097 RepID=A0AAD4IKV0_9PLEO|nr:hypothetical protein G6011_01621 [Alternaria panax]